MGQVHQLEVFKEQLQLNLIIIILFLMELIVLQKGTLLTLHVTKSMNTIQDLEVFYFLIPLLFIHLLLDLRKTNLQGLATFPVLIRPHWSTRVLPLEVQAIILVKHILTISEFMPSTTTSSVL